MQGRKMAKYKRCIPCGGSGKVMGGGMLIVDCGDCNGYGKIEECDDEIEYLTFKQSESYQKAVKDITEANPGIEQSKVETMLNEEIKNAYVETRPKKGKYYDKKTT